MKAGNLPASTFAGTPLEDLDVGTGGYSFDAYIPYRAPPVIQFRAQTATLLGMRFGDFKVGFLDGGRIGVRANLDVFGARYQMVGSITTGPNPRLRMTNTAGLTLFGQRIARGQLEVQIGRDDAVLHVSGNVRLSGVDFELDRTFSAAELLNEAAQLSLPLPPVEFDSDLRIDLGGRSFGVQVAGSSRGTLSARPSVTASGSVAIHADAIRISVAPVCTPRVCTPGACTPRVCTPGACTPGACTPRVCTPGACTPRACAPRVCTPRICTALGCTPQHCEPERCTPRHCEPEQCVAARCAPETCAPDTCVEARCADPVCEPEHCTPPTTTETPAVDESASFRDVTVSTDGITVGVPRAGNRRVQPRHRSPPPRPQPNQEAELSAAPPGPEVDRPLPLGPAAAAAPAPAPTPSRPAPTPYPLHEPRPDVTSPGPHALAHGSRTHADRSPPTWAAAAARGSFVASAASVRLGPAR